MSFSQLAVKIPASATINELLYFGLDGMDAARMAAKGFEVRRASYIQQPWAEMEKPVSLIEYGNDMYLLKF
jgi:hypothetical protein